MTGKMDPRVHALLDGELEQFDAKLLRERLASDLKARQELSRLEQVLAAAQRPAPPLPDDFERRVLARVAARPAPRPGLWSRLFAPRPGLTLSWSTAAAAACCAVLIAGVGAFAGYRAGQRTAPAVEPAAAEAGAPQKVLVRFAISAPSANKVELVGNFNGWGARGIELSPGDNGTWVASVELPRGHWEYTFVVDGERWVPDPAAAQLVDDGFGGSNAVLEL